MKKKIFTGLLCVLFTGALSAQLHFDGSDNVYYGEVSDVGEEVTAEWDVVNSTDMVLELSGKRVAIQEVDGADGNFCWGLLCIAWSTGDYNASSEVVYMNPGDVNNSFKAKYRHKGNSGQAVYEYCIYDVNRVVDDVCQVVNYCVNSDCFIITSTDNAQDFGGEIEVSPNPIESVGNITYSFKKSPSNAKMVIYNTVGVKVKEIPLRNREGVVFLGSSDFASGLYFCSIEDNGIVHQTAKVIFK